MAQTNIVLREREDGLFEMVDGAARLEASRGTTAKMLVGQIVIRAADGAAEAEAAARRAQQETMDW